MDWSRKVNPVTDVAAVLKAKVDGHASEAIIYAKVSPQPQPTANNQQPLWIVVTIIVLTVLLVLCVVVFVAFFKIRPRK
jgi:type VI protein secretion system component VasF